MKLFERHLSHIIDGTLGKRSVSIEYDYSEIIRSLMCVYFCGGSFLSKVNATGEPLRMWLGNKGHTLL